MNKLSLVARNKILLAPMEEINDIAFRLLCKKAGCGLTYTGMINPLSKQKFYLDDKPILQLFCANTRGIKEFMKKYDRKVSGWDFNLGCLAKTARKHGFGSFLHSDQKTIRKILKTMRENTKKPLSVKLRKSKHTLKILKIAEEYCDTITIHPRTQQQGYGGKPEIKFAEKLKSKTKLPIVYSGNVDENNYKNLLKKFDFVMVGRNAIGNPNIFAKLTGKKYFPTFKDYLELAKKFELPFRQIKLQAMNFTKGMRNGRKIRLKIFETRKIKEIEKISELISSSSF